MDLFPNTRDDFKEDLIMLQNTVIKQLLGGFFWLDLLGVFLVGLFFFFLYNMLPQGRFQFKTGTSFGLFFN